MLWFFIGLMLFFFSLNMILRLPVVQTFVTAKVAEFLSNELNSEIRIDEVHYTFFDRLQMRGLYVGDQQGDTLLYTDQLKVNLHFWRLRDRMVEFDLIQFDNPFFNLKQFADSVGGTNLDFIVHYFKPSDPDTANQKPLALYSDALRINNAHFKFRKSGEQRKPFGVDFKDLDLTDINISMEKVELLKDTLYADIRHIELLEQSGFRIDSLSAQMQLSSGDMTYNNLQLVTENSSIRSDLIFEYDSFKSFKNFIDSVNIRSDFRESDLNFTDISYFAPDLQGFAQYLEIDGRVRGVVSDLRGRDLHVEFGEHSYFLGDCHLTGLPDVENTFVELNIRQLSTSASDLEYIQLPPFTEKNHVQLPEQFSQLGSILFDGQFIGFYNDFVAYGNMRSDIGRIGLDLGFKNQEGETQYTGRLATSQFNFGRFLQIKGLEQVTSNVSISGRGLELETINADVDGAVEQLVFRNYSYEGIELSANLEKNLFNGHLKLNDENLSIDFDGLVDMRSDTAQFDFVTNIFHADPGALNLLPLEGYSSLTSRVEVNGTATSIDNFKGEVVAKATAFCLENDSLDTELEYEFGDIVLTSYRDPQGRIITLTSDVVDAEVTGFFELAALPKGFLLSVQSVLPSLIPDSGPALQADQWFDYRVMVKDFTVVNELVVPNIDFGNRTEINGSFNSNKMFFDLNFSTDYFRLANFAFDSVRVEAEKNSDVMGLQLYVDHMPLSDSLYFNQIDFRAVAYQDNMDGNLIFTDNNNHESRIPITALVHNQQRFEIAIDSAEIYLLGERWHNDSLSLLAVDTTSLHFTDFNFVSGERQIRIDGTISEDMTEQLLFDIQEFDVALLNAISPPDFPRFYGILNANGFLEGARKSRYIECDLDLRSFQIENQFLGRALVEARWNFGESLLDIKGNMLYRDTETIVLAGTYNPQLEESPLNARVAFVDFDLALLDVFIKAGVSEFEGLLTGSVDVTGSFKEPLFSGELDMNNAGVKVDFLNTKYYLNDKVVVAPDYIGFDYIPIKDQEGHNGFLVGTLFHENFRNLNYNFYVEMKEMVVLNTTLHDNDLFYGKAYSSGTVDVSGYGQEVQIEVTAATDPGTFIYLPLGGPTEVSLERFVTFVSDGQTEQIQSELDLAGITLIMDLQVTPDMQIELVFDESLGDMLRARGTGAINMEITPDGQFAMFGRYEIEEGEYLFTLQNIINKRFSIEKGGVIGWYGDPYNADINVNAVYKSRASLADLMGEFAEGYTSRVPVHLNLSLTNKLLNPNVDFSVTLPSADESMQNLVNSVLSTEEEKNKQAFSLLVLNRFLPPANRAATSNVASMNIGAATTTDVLSSQLSNWLSQISDDFNVGVNYRPGDNITNEELAVALSTQLLNNRLLLSGSFGVSNTPQNIAETNNQVIGDFLAEYLITEEGKLRLKVFSESADYNILQSYRTGTVQGAGISYQEDFDTFSDLACKLRNLLRKKGAKVDCNDLY